MLLIHCPYCGPRAQIEFRNDGESRPRPDDPMSMEDAHWTDYLFSRTNFKGVVTELWWHQHGCKQWFEARRNTIDNTFVGTEQPTGTDS